MTTIILQRYANREYRLTCQSVLSGKKKSGDKFKEVQAEKYAQAVHSTYVLSKNIDEGAIAEISDGCFVVEQFGEVAARQALCALDIIDEFHLVQKVVQKGGWGHLSKPTSFTKNARHRLLEAGAIVDKFCGLNAYEITCTLPGSTRNSMKVLAKHTGWIMNELTRLIRKTKCKYWFYVWEFQRRGALHLHLLVASPNENMQSLAEKLQSRWWVLLKSISRKTGQDVFARKTGGTWKNTPIRWQSHIAPISKSVAAYFSKYAGKGHLSSLKSSTSNQVYTPSRWWGCSTEIKEQIKKQRQKYTLTVSSITAQKIMTYLHSMLDDRDMVRRYDYSFDLGKTANNTTLGCGDVCIRYYNDAGFARMRQWEKIIWDGALGIAKDADEYGDPMQTWTYADMACPTPLDADMEIRRHRNADIVTQTCTPHPSPHSQQSSISRKLSKSRGTQAKPTLELRARLIQFLAGGDGGYSAKGPDDCPPDSLPERPIEYVQGELFNVKNCCSGLTSWDPVQEYGGSTSY